MNAVTRAALDLLAFYGVCAAGWLLFEKLRVPTAAILGPIAVAGLASVLGLPLAAPFFVKTGLSVVMGAVLGLRFNLRVKGLVREVLLVGLWLVGLSLLAAKALGFAGVDAPTALFAAMPGGIAEISLMALGFGADAFVVALLQSTRLLLTMLVFPALARRAVPSGAAPVPATRVQAAPAQGPRPRDWAAIAALAPMAAMLFQWLGVPAGAMLGPMLAVGLYTKWRGITAQPNRTLQKWLQAGVGGLVGLGITRASAMAIGSYLLPILILNLVVVGGSLVLALLLQKLSGWDRATCLLACSPAGLSPTILLSVELAADSGRVVLFQVLRLVSVLVFAPVSARMLL